MGKSAVQEREKSTGTESRGKAAPEIWELSRERHLRERPQALEAPRHRRGEAPLAAQGREEQPVLGPVGLVGAVAAAKLLDRFVSAPGQLQCEMHPPALILCPPAYRAHSVSR